MFALIDGNSFYASCERIYRPELRHAPVVVLSNNDGCVITRTPEAKALGIKMGEPYFKITKLIKQCGISVFSSNYELYGDVSRRMMSTIGTLVPRAEVYSIDECFADLTGMSPLYSDIALSDLGQEIRSRVLQWVGIPTCVGIAQTKTLAKFCNHLAKKYPYFKGVVNWSTFDPDLQMRALKSQSASEVWGVGRRIGKKLTAMNIHTAYDLSIFDTGTLRKTFGVMVERTQRELQGFPCLELEEIQPIRQQISRSRSFGQPVMKLEGLKSALTHHVMEATQDLRKQNSVANIVGIRMQTNPFHEDQTQYYANDAIALPFATCDTIKINEYAQALLEGLFKEHLPYKKCGVFLTGLESNVPTGQMDWLKSTDTDERIHLMSHLDQINSRFGKGTIKPGTASLDDGWQMRRNMLSPCFTTRIDEAVKAN